MSDRDDDFIRTVAGQVALQLAPTPEGRAIGLSVDVGPGEVVRLVARAGHELRVFAERSGGAVSVRWMQRDPGEQSPRAEPSPGNLSARGG